MLIQNIILRESPLSDPAHHCSPDHSDGFTVIYPINGPVPVLIYVNSIVHRGEYRNHIGYAQDVQLDSIAMQRADGSRGTQDRITAAVLARVDHNNNEEDYVPVRYVAVPGRPLFIPHGCIFRTGGMLPQDTLHLVDPIKKNSRLTCVPIFHLEFIMSTTTAPVSMFQELSDPRDDPFYFPMTNFIPIDHMEFTAPLYVRSRQPVPAWRFRSWARSRQIHEALHTQTKSCLIVV